MLDASHFLARGLIGLMARIVERGGDEVFEHLLVFKHHKPVVDRDREDAALGGAADLDQPAARDALDLDAVELDLRLVHLLLDRLGCLLRGEGEGAPTLRERDEAAKAEEDNRVRNSPIVQAAFEAFPAAELVDEGKDGNWSKRA